MEKSLFINGQWLEGQGESLKSFSPFTQELIYEKRSASFDQIDACLKHAKNAFTHWSGLTLDERLEYLYKFRNLLEENKEEAAKILAKDSGKLLWDSKGEIQASIAKLDICVQAYHDRTPTKDWSAGGLNFAIRHRPHGVIAVFAPFNFPFHLPNGHILPALLAGNCVVLKPSELTPFCSEFMVKLWEQAGLPDGVLNLIQGQKNVGQYLSQHALIDGLYFTGSAQTGAILAKQLALTPEKILALELGGNNPYIFSSCADMRVAVNLIIQSAFISSGQRCTCARRLIIVKSKQSDQLISDLVSASQRLKIGKAWDQTDAFYGPLVSINSAENILHRQQDLLKQGASILSESKQDANNPYLVSCGILETTSISVSDEECFAPLLTITQVASLDEAITQASDTRYGLSAGLISQEKKEFEKVVNKIKAGIINWNAPTTGASSAAPFGGVGISGNHRPAAYYAADYSAYPCVSTFNEAPTLSTQLPPGISL